MSFPDVYSQLPENSPRNILEVKWSNDFVFMTDRNFSNGFELNYYNVAIGKSPIRFLLLPSQNADHIWHGVTMIQNLYTPDHLFSPDVDLNDRPYASYFLVGQRKVAINQSSLLKVQSELQLGLLGKYSGGQTIQNRIHDILPASRSALGWDNQLQPDFAANYMIMVEKGILNSEKFELNAYFKSSLGIPNTNIGSGIRLRTGRFNNYFSNLGLSTQKGHQMYFFIDVAGSYVIYNATLQGGLFTTDNTHSLNSINTLLGEINSGFAFTVSNFGVELGAHFLTSEFDGGRNHKWGYIKFSFGF